MFKLDNNFLTSLGLSALPVEEKNKLLQHIYERLEMNVGMRLAEKMTDSQLDEFEGFIDRNDETGALRWLETNFPNYKEVVAEELEKLKKEVSEAAPHILAAANDPVAPTQSSAIDKQSFSDPIQPQHLSQTTMQPDAPQLQPLPHTPVNPYGQPVPQQQPGFQQNPNFTPAQQPNQNVGSQPSFPPAQSGQPLPPGHQPSTNF